MVYPLNLFAIFYSPLFLPARFCVFLRYFRYVTGAHISNAHFLIAVNRLWAISSPVTYRQYHQGNAASASAKVCALAWLYVQALTIPWTIVDAVNRSGTRYEVPSCAISGKVPRAWELTGQFLLYNIPILLTLLIYPVVWWKTINQKQLRRAMVAPLGTATGNSGARINRAKKDGSFLALSLLIVNVTCTVVPAFVFYTLVGFRMAPAYLMVPVFVLFSLSPIVDSLLFLFFIKTLRAALGKCCRF